MGLEGYIYIGPIGGQDNSLSTSMSWEFLEAMGWGGGRLQSSPNRLLDPAGGYFGGKLGGLGGGGVLSR